MRKNFLKILLLCVIFATCIPTRADSLDDAKEFFAELDGNGGHFELQEVEILDGIKVLEVSAVASAEDGYGEVNNFINNKTDYCKNMIQNDWFDYTCLIENTYYEENLITTKIYNIRGDYSAETTWISDGLSYEQLSTGLKLSYYPKLMTDIPYEENIELHMYKIAQDIVNSNFDSFCEYPEYYSASPNIKITYDETNAEVSGYVNVEDEKHLYCVQFSYKNEGGANYSYDMTYAFIEGIGTSGAYIPMN